MSDNVEKRFETDIYVDYNKVGEFDIRGVVHYEFVPTGQNSQPSLLFGSIEKAAWKS